MVISEVNLFYSLKCSFKNTDFFFLFYVYEWFAHMYVRVLHVWLVPEEAKKRVLDPMELELQEVISCSLGR